MLGGDAALAFSWTISLMDTRGLRDGLLINAPPPAGGMQEGEILCNRGETLVRKWEFRGDVSYVRFTYSLFDVAASNY